MSIALSSEKQVELAAQLHGVDDDRILAFEIQDADLQQPPISSGSDHHGEIFIEVDPPHGVAHGVPDVLFVDGVLPGRLANPHLDNIPCLGYRARCQVPTPTQNCSPRTWIAFPAPAGSTSGEKTIGGRRISPAQRLNRVFGTHKLAEQASTINFLILDTKFTASFDAVFAAEGTRIIKSPVRAPRSNAICERAIGTIRRECLDRMLILGRRHLEAVLAEYVEHYNAHRPHRSIGQRPPARSEATPSTISDVDAARLRRADRLGGLIHEYRMVA